MVIQGQWRDFIGTIFWNPKTEQISTPGRFSTILLVFIISPNLRNDDVRHKKYRLKRRKNKIRKKVKV